MLLPCFLPFLATKGLRVLEKKVNETQASKIVFSHLNWLFNKLTSVFSCVCPVIDHKFRHHIVKVAVDPRGDSRVDPQTTLTM